MKKALCVLLLCVAVLPAFSQGIFDQSADWTLTADGNLKAPGMASFSDGVYTLEGNGDDIWNNADEGYYIYKDMTGSFSITSLMSWLDPGTNDWSKMITMIREKGDLPGSKYFGSQLRGANYGDQVHATWRTNEDGGSTSFQFFRPGPNPGDADVAVEATIEGIWVRTTRIADLNLFYSEWSEDGSTWHYGTQQQIEMGDAVTAGLAVTNHENDENVAVGEFYNVEISTNLPTLPTTAMRSFSSGSFKAGDAVTVSVTVLNPNTADASVNVIDSAPDGWAASSASNGGTITGPTVTWNIQAPHGYTTLTYTATAPTSPPPVNAWTGSIGSTNTAGASVMTQAQDKPEGDQIFDQHADIIHSIDEVGGEDLLGTAEYDPATQTYTLSGSGNDIWGNYDNFHFLYTTVSGDFNMEARIIHDESARSTSTDVWIKGMLMARQNLTPGSPNFGNRMRRDGQYSWQLRATQDGGSSSDGNNRVTFSSEGYTADAFPPVRVERRGDEWSIFYKDELGSGDWIQVQSTQTLVLEDPIYVGLAVTAHQVGSIQYTWFKDVKLEVIGDVQGWDLY
ncbi:MAG: hypothetical protein GC154_04970 [bacterium]|nr:hypothetical protein [bacterium]